MPFLIGLIQADFDADLAHLIEFQLHVLQVHVPFGLRLQSNSFLFMK
jgi:hypothetical protein